MSDGNFNRSMLPSNNYQSGIRAGRAQMKSMALAAFRSWLISQHPEADGSSIESQCVEFKKILDK